MNGLPQDKRINCAGNLTKLVGKKISNITVDCLTNTRVLCIVTDDGQYAYITADVLEDDTSACMEFDDTMDKYLQVKAGLITLEQCENIGAAEDTIWRAKLLNDDRLLRSFVSMVQDKGKIGGGQ